MVNDVYLSLGSNIGSRLDYLRKALKHLEQFRDLEIVLKSSVYETKAVTFDEQADYLNAVIAINTVMKPERLSQVIHEIEIKCGRVRTGYQAPRTLDIDILIFGKMVIVQPTLIVPHPRMLARGFVMIPLMEIAPQLVHPQEMKSIAQLVGEINYSGVKLLPDVAL